MKISATNIPEIKIVEPIVHADLRGFFLESMNMKKLWDLGINVSFVQENQAYSKKGVIRGLHYQAHPHAQGKLVRAVYGEILDVAVDIRTGSPTYGKHVKVLLTGDNNLQLWIPPGFAHGALTLSEFSLLAYFCTEEYSEECSRAIAYDDPDLAIDWQTSPLISSPADQIAPRLKDIAPEFIYNAGT